MYLEKVAVDYLKTVNIDKIFKKYFISELTNKTINLRGNNNEFLEHREYQYSDDLKNINWKIFAKTGKLFTKIFSTDITKDITILLDTSYSMIAGSNIPKIEYSKYLITITSYKLSEEGYKIILSTFNSNLGNLISFNIKNFSRMDIYLKNIKCYGKTNFKEVIKNLPNFVSKNSNILIVSDLIFIKPEEISLLRKMFPKQDIVIFQVLSPEEISFIDDDFAELLEPENRIKKIISPKTLKKTYLDRISEFFEKTYQIASINKIPLITFNTSIPYYVILKSI